MQTCPECGNHDMRVVQRDGASVHECGLCGATFGDRRAVRGAELADEAFARGVDEEIWPLARVLERLPGFTLGSCSAGGRGGLPFVELVVAGHEALVQLENLAKAVRLAAGALRCRWLLEARFENTLVVVVRADGGEQELRDARIDVEALARHVDRDMRLTWWRHAEDGQNG
ncbi:MAG: zf-TFIIB domain-containing protein [Planctomycetota bacterium]